MWSDPYFPKYFAWLTNATIKEWAAVNNKMTNNISKSVKINRMVKGNVVAMPTL